MNGLAGQSTARAYQPPRGDLTRPTHKMAGSDLVAVAVRKAGASGLAARRGYYSLVPPLGAVVSS